MKFNLANIINSIRDEIKYIFSKDPDFKTLRYLKDNKQKFITKKKFILAGQTFNVYIYKKPEDYLLGQYTKHKTIIINKKIFNHSKDFQKYILLHELGHKMTPWPAKLLSAGLFMTAAILLIFATLLTVIFSTYMLILIAISMIFGNWINLTFLLPILIIQIALLLIVRLSQFISEGYAECYVVKKTSEKFYLKIQPEYLKIRQNNKKRRLKKMTIKKYPIYLFWRIYGWISYPKPKFVIQTYYTLKIVKKLFKTL